MRNFFALIAVAALLGGCAQMSARMTRASGEVAQADAFSTYLSARFAAQQHDMPQAARYYSETLQNDPDNTGLLSLAFFYSSTAGDLDAASVYAGKIVAATPDDRAARLALAVVAFRHKDYAGVRRHLAASAKGPFTVLTVSLFDAWAAAALGDTAGVAADLKALGGQSGAESVAAFHAALIADFSGNAKEALSLYTKAVALNAGSPRVIDAYGRFLERQGRTEDAAKLYRALGVSTALSPLAQAGLARLAAGGKAKPEPLVATAEQGAAEGLFGIAASLNDASSADVSILYLRMALYLQPDLALAQILLADRFEALQKFDDAAAIYAGIDKASPYYRMASVEAALNQSRLGKNDVAVRDLKALTDADATDSESWIALGDAYRGAEKYGEAVSAYDRAEAAIAKPTRRNWSLYYARAMAQEKAGNWAKAEADVTAGLKLSPDQPELLNYLGYSWVDQGRRYEEALVLLEKARTLRPDDGYIVDSVGWAYYRMGRYQQAAETLEAAVLLVPGDATVNDHLGDALWKAGRRIEARFQWNHALAFDPEAAQKAALEQKLKNGLAG